MNIGITELAHQLDLAAARIKELEGVNLALIAERDMLRSELEGLKNQKPVAYSWLDDVTDEPFVIGADRYDGSFMAYPLYAKPIPPAIPEGMALVPIDPVPSAVAAMAREIQSKAGWVSGDTYRACIVTAQKGGA